uniref:CSON005944 protein n=1 Tax=Culicoides sonorensis TaxID=179676 RepID=A0A336L8E3_CULSO
MPIEENQDEVNSPKKTRGAKSVIKQELISPPEEVKITPARRVTRRTSQLEDANETMEEVAASPAPTRRSTRARKPTIDETAFDTSVKTPRRSSRARASSISESEHPVEMQVGTPKRITRRSASIQSDDGNTVNHPVQKQPSEATIQEEETPISRRTRASSITSDDGNVGTPKKRGRKSLAANVKLVEPVIEEEESPSRPVTRSMSDSPANVTSEKSPLKPKSPLVTEKSSDNVNEVKIEESEQGTQDETIMTIAQEVTEKLSNGSLQSPDAFSKTPSKSGKTPDKNDSSKLEERTPKTSETPKSVSKTSSVGKSPKDQMTPLMTGKKSQKSTPLAQNAEEVEQTPVTSGKKSKKSIPNTPMVLIVENTPVTSGKKSKKSTPNTSMDVMEQTPVVKGKISITQLEVETKTPKSSSKKNKKTEYLSQTPQPIKSNANEETEQESIFSKSWSQPVRGSAAKTPKIDEFSIKKLPTPQKVSSSQKKTPKQMVFESSSDDTDEEPDNDFEEFVDDQAKAVKDYHSGDSMDEDDREIAVEYEMHEEHGEDIGSEDTEGDEESEEGSDDSFIASEGEVELLSYSDDDEHLDDTPSKSKRKSAPARVMVLESSDSDSDDQEKNKSQSEKKKLPKIKLQQRQSAGDPDISLKPLDVTLFNSSTADANMTRKSLNKTALNPTIEEENEDDEMEQDKRLSLNQSLKDSVENGDESESEFILPDASPAELKAAESSLLNLSKKTRKSRDSERSNSFSLNLNVSGASMQTKLSEKTSQNDSVKGKPQETDSESSDNEDVDKTVDKTTNKSMNKSKNVQIEETSSDDSDKEVDETVNKTANKSLNKSKNVQIEETSSDSSEDDEQVEQIEIDEPAPVGESESAKRKRRRRTAGLDETVAEQNPVKKPKMSLVPEEKLDSILEKCNEILKTKKEEKKKNKLLHKKQKEEKKKRKELLKQQAQEQEGSNAENADPKEESPKKKKKKQKIGRKYNQEITDSANPDKHEEISQALKRSQELLEKKREKKRAKKLAKLEKAKAEGLDVTLKSVKSDKENNNKSENIKEKEKSKDEKPAKKKTLLTAFEVKQSLIENGNITNSNGKEKKKSKKSEGNKNEESMTDKENTSKISTKSVELTPREQENTVKESSKKQKKKKSKVLEPVQDSNQSDSSPSMPPAKKRMLSILNPKGSLNQQGFAVIPETPEAERLKRNRGFVEEPVTPKNIGFKVQSMMPTGEDFVKKANKKRKRTERDIPEPSRGPPKPVWTSAGVFEEIDAPETSDYIPLSTASRAATQFGISVLNKKYEQETKNGTSQGLSSFKMKALYKDKAHLRETSKDLARKLEKQKKFKGLNA